MSANSQLFPAKMSQSKYLTRQKLTASAQLTHRQQGDGNPAGKEKKQASQRGTKRRHVRVDYHEDNINEPYPIKTEPFDSRNSPPLEGSPGATQYVFKVKDEPESKTVKWEPPLWQEQLANIFEMRKFRDAPVDSMGCDVIGDRDASPKVIVSRVCVCVCARACM